MKVILKEDVENLGRLGDVKDVAPGYARNYLIPNGMVIRATNRNLAQVEHERRLIDAKLSKRREEAGALAKRMEAMTLSMPVKVGEDGRLFGSVTSKHLADALAAQGFNVDRRGIHLDGPIKTVGDRKVGVDLGYGVLATLKVSVVAESVEPEASEPEETAS